MQLVSSAKLNRMDGILATVRPYFASIAQVLGNVLSSVEKANSPFLEKRAIGTGKICLCVIASDGGLCGVYNANILRLADDFIKKQGENRVKLVVIGKKGFNYFRKRQGLEIIKSYIGLNGKYSETVAKDITETLKNIYLSGGVDSVYIAYAHFINAMTHRPTVEKFLNIEMDRAKPNQFIFDPDKDAVLEELIPRYIGIKLRLRILEAFTSEHASRTIAMKMATENADEMLQRLTLVRNKLRQAIITQEMLELISSVEALKG
jgi:F-type H+-transporting ATPase subunit gamma